MVPAKKPKTEARRRWAQPRANRVRTWAFRFLSILIIPLVFFGVLELVLRLCGAGYPTGIAVPCKVHGRPAYTHNIKFGWRFFPPRIARQFDGFVFEARKPPGTYRIFVLGESAAAGMPAPEYNFARILEVMLNETCPGIRFEVITAAMPAINSHVLVDVAADCARLEPDLFILYMGNNEVVGPFGPGTVFAPLSPNRAAIRLHMAVKKTRIGQMADFLIQSIKPASKTPQRWGGLAMFLDKQVRFDSPQLETAYRHFETNVSEICRIARKAGAQVLISNVGCNLRDCPPFASLHRSDLTESEKQKWEEIYQKGIEQEEGGDFGGAVALYQEAARIDPTFADLQFRIGHCVDQAGDPNAAGIYYRAALQYDTVRLRADERINRILRQAAEGKNGISFVDTVSALEEDSSGRNPGEEFFYEHVHFTFEGHYLAARAMFLKVMEILPESQKPGNPIPPDRQECARRLAYTGFERAILWEPLVNEMLSEPPFTGQLYHELFMKKVRRRMEELGVWLERSRAEALKPVYEEAIGRNPEDWMLHWRYSIFLKRGLRDYEAEEVHLRKALELCPHNVTVYLNLGRNLHRQGRYREAQEILQEFLNVKPNSAEAYVELARICKTRKDNDLYIRYLSKATSLAPAVSVDPYRALAEVYWLTGRSEKAIGALQQAIRIFPEEQTAQVHADLGSLLISRGEYDKALAEMKQAAKINPDLAKDAKFQQILTDLEKKIRP
jgi:tetratricopeptide (TPR) repeat protein